jgi:signal transduction histidine kinase/DNA-binding response OmpR family regulator
MAKILIVDDKPANRLFLVTLLKYMSHQLFEAANGKEALLVTRDQRPDLVISDVLMPVMDGFEYVRALRAEPHIGATPVIFYTSTYRTPEAAALAARCGVNTVLRKPSDPEVILAAVEKELGEKSASVVAPVAESYEKSEGGIPNWAGRAVGARLRIREAAGELGAQAAGLHKLNASLTSIIELMLEVTPEKGADHVVELFFNAAHRLINSRYAALLIHDAEGLRRLQTKGIDPVVYTRASAGTLPDTLMKDWGVVRLPEGRMPEDGHSMAINDSLPPDHPAVNTLLAVTIASKDCIHGCIVLANKVGGAYTDEDERLLATLATELAVFYESAEVYDTLQRHAAKLQLEMSLRMEAEEKARSHEHKLAQAQKMETVGQLTGGLAHDFNNLLGVIQGANEYLHAEVGHLPRAAAQVRLINQAARRGADLVRQLMSFSRKQDLKPAVTDLNELLEKTSALLRKAVARNITLRIEAADDLPAVFVDAITLENVILNLALNARDAMAKGGALTLSTTRATLDNVYVTDNPEAKAGSYVLLSVSDTGAGMQAPVIARAFEPFFTTKEAGKGTGLGLSMVYGFVQQSGGHVKIVSEVGVGTTIKVFLPPASTAPVKAGAAAPSGPDVRDKARILLVEDDELVRASVEARLHWLGHIVTPVASPVQALDTLEHTPGFDLLFTDIVMPGRMTGADLAREVMLRWPAVKVLATSGYGESALHGKITLPEGVRLLTKPYATADLTGAIHALMTEAAYPS